MDLALKNLQWLICHNTQPNQTRRDHLGDLRRFSVTKSLVKEASTNAGVKNSQRSKIILMCLYTAVWFQVFNTYNFYRIILF